MVILREEHLNLTERRLFMRLEMPNPQVVVEVVRLGKDNRKRDYTDKREQYQQRGIPEYWLLNPETQTIEVLELKDGRYAEFGRFQGSDPVRSPNFNTPPFTAAQVFSLGAS